MRDVTPVLQDMPTGNQAWAAQASYADAAAAAGVVVKGTAAIQQESSVMSCAVCAPSYHLETTLAPHDWQSFFKCELVAQTRHRH